MEIKRLQEKKLIKCLETSGAVQVVGPKWSGKTFISKKNSKSVYYVQDEGTLNQLIINEPIESSSIFNGEKPRLIDEWQIVPQIWDKVRFIVDMNNGQRGQYILTGSTTPVDKKKIIHSGAGRFSQLKMSTLSINEIYPEEGKYSLQDLFDGKIKSVSGQTKLTLVDIVNAMIKGGWPDIIANGDVEDDNFIESYINWISDMDTSSINGTRNSKTNFQKILKSIARLNGSQINESTIVNDTELNVRTVQKYLEVLETSYIINYLYPWSPNARSKNTMRTKPKLYLCDTSIGFSLLGINSYEKAVKDLRTLGLYFENQVIKDIEVYAQNISAKVYYYRDKNDNEIDLIIELKDGRWGIAEIKLRNHDLEDTANRLLNFKNYFEFEKYADDKESFAIIITAADKAYTLPNGVHVIPHAMLKP